MNYQSIRTEAAWSEVACLDFSPLQEIFFRKIKVSCTVHPSVLLQAGVQMFTCHSRQTRPEVKDLKDAPKPPHHILCSHLAFSFSVCLNFKPFPHALTAPVLKRLYSFCSRRMEGKTTSSALVQVLSDY